MTVLGEDVICMKITQTRGRTMNVWEKGFHSTDTNINLNSYILRYYLESSWKLLKYLQNIIFMELKITPGNITLKKAKIHRGTSKTYGKQVQMFISIPHK